MNKLNIEYLQVPKQSSPSSRTSSCDSDNTEPNKYKTQLCRKFQQMGYCPYGSKCRFAHGKHQLVASTVKGKYKKKCNGFWIHGCCPYGRRCRFTHEEWNWQSSALLMGLQAQCIDVQHSCKCSKLMRMLE